MANLIRGHAGANHQSGSGGDWRVRELVRGGAPTAEAARPTLNVIATVVGAFSLPVATVGSTAVTGVGNFVFRTTISATARKSLAQADAFIVTALANPATRGLAKKLVEHQQKLLNYIRNPLSADNKGFLKNASSPQLFEKIYRARVKELVHQINNFHKQIKDRLP